MTYLLDTNIITAILKGNNKVSQKIKEILLNREDISINAISYYEIKRGLLSVGALTKLITKFEELYKAFGITLLDSVLIFDKAAEIYATLRPQGKPIEDADILIASLAQEKDFILVSNDTHFNRIPDLKIENWLN
ncbi:MAG: PIN domain-containing protein [Planctomycetota bacterium]